LIFAQSDSVRFQYRLELLPEPYFDGPRPAQLPAGAFVGIRPLVSSQFQ